MDRETLANFISNLGKRDFEKACRLALQEALHLIVVNVDGPYDGGTDFVALTETGARNVAAYQITTQKSSIQNKAYRDAEKSIRKLGVSRFFFLCTYNLTEIESRALENTISTELGLHASVYAPTLIADLMLSYSLVGRFLDEIHYDDLHRFEKTDVDYREMALHGYSLLSKDAKNMKLQIYDDALLQVLADKEEGLTREEIVHDAIELLSLPLSKEDHLMRRIDALSTKGWIYKAPIDASRWMLSPDVVLDIRNRRVIYERELTDLSAAQVDLMNEYGAQWTKDDSRKTSVWIAHIYMYRQLKTLEAIDAVLADNFFKYIDKDSLRKLRTFLTETTGIAKDVVDDVINRLLEQAALHPLLLKITSASVYLALEGSNPLSASKAIGASSWHEVNLLLEPTLAIPYLCSILYKGHVNRHFDNAIRAVKRAKELGSPISIPYYYIKECAGHLHMARKFDGLNLNPQEMQFSSNAFVANYYALKLQGVPVPEKFMDYLATFSPAIRVEQADYKSWIRQIMTNLQSLLTRNNVEFQDIPQYTDEELRTVESIFAHYLNKENISKPHHLMRNDAISLLFVESQMAKTKEIWMLLTYDRALIQVAQECTCPAWVNTPFAYLDITEMSKDMGERKLFSLIHSMATFSNRTLSIGARILDRIVQYASDKMQDWQFQEAIRQFKEEMVNNISSADTEYMTEVDKRTQEFLSKHGVTIEEHEEQNDVDIE